MGSEDRELTKLCRTNAKRSICFPSRFRTDLLVRTPGQISPTKDILKYIRTGESSDFQFFLNTDFSNAVWSYDLKILLVSKFEFFGFVQLPMILQHLHRCSGISVNMKWRLLLISPKLQNIPVSWDCILIGP